MTTNKVNEIIKESVIKIINNTTSNSKIKKVILKHEAKTHFIPVKYRIFGGLLQSLNIQFGNFIEVLMQKIIEQEKQFEIITEISGKKNVLLPLAEETNSLIDQFIFNRQNNNDNKLTENFEQLLKNIVANQQFAEKSTIKRDVDVLFRNKKNGNYYYLELKYNDDHDTGKFVDINRKFIKTYAGLIKKLGIQDVNQLKPILYYLNKKIMKGNIYVPEETHIYRGERLFREFLTIKYADIDEYLKNISEDKEIVEIFDKLYQRIRYEK